MRKTSDLNYLITAFKDKQVGKNMVIFLSSIIQVIRAPSSFNNHSLVGNPSPPP